MKHAATRMIVILVGAGLLFDAFAEGDVQPLIVIIGVLWIGLLGARAMQGNR